MTTSTNTPSTDTYSSIVTPPTELETAATEYRVTIKREQALRGVLVALSAARRAIADAEMALSMAGIDPYTIQSQVQHEAERKLLAVAGRAV